MILKHIKNTACSTQNPSESRDKDIKRQQKEVIEKQKEVTIVSETKQIIEKGNQQDLPSA